MLGVFTVGLLVMLSAAVIAQGHSERYLIKSDDNTLKAMYGVQHKFSNGFTTDLNSNQVKALKKLGVGVEEVGFGTVSAPPGACSPWPECNNGGETGRVYFPDVQIPYGVAMVNGGSGGAGVTVAVLDTGVNKDHLDLDVVLCKDTTRRGIQNGCNDNVGHGTHVAGTVAANGGNDGLGIYGVAPEANLWAIKVCKTNLCSWDDVAEGIYYATDQGADVISISIGGDSQSSVLKNAVDYAVSLGVLVVAAAGNDGPSTGSIDWPSAYSNVVSVGAIDSNKSVPDFSSRGINDGDYVVEDREVEFGAPGVAVLSTSLNGGYELMSGTSMATPHVSGLAAKLWQGDALSTRIYLQNLARGHDLYIPGDDSATGFGLIVAP